MSPAATRFRLEQAMLRWSSAVDSPLASPIDADLTGLAPPIVQVVGFDPLRDEGEA